MATIATWTAMAERLHQTGLNIFATAEVPITDKGYSDENFLALTLLARTLSNLKGALLLLGARQIVEARTITRCCFENWYWVIALAEEGAVFVRKMLGDEMTHRKHAGQSIFENGLKLEAETEVRLREWIKDTNKKFRDAKTLHPKQVAGNKNVRSSYLFYSALSSDAAHPSVSALNRYVVPHTQDALGGVDVCPTVKDEEIEQTLEFLCMAVMSVGVAVNHMIGGTHGGQPLQSMGNEFIALSNKCAELRRAKGKEKAPAA
jgi:hypothetical protein